MTRVGRAAGRGVAEAVELLIGALADPQDAGDLADPPPHVARQLPPRRPVRFGRGRAQRANVAGGGRCGARTSTGRARRADVAGRCIRSGGSTTALSPPSTPRWRPSGTTPPRGHSVRPAGQQVVHPSCNLDRLAEAEQTLRESHRVAAEHGLATGLQVSAAVHHYWTGQWDEALAELELGDRATAPPSRSVAPGNRVRRRCCCTESPH